MISSGNHVPYTLNLFPTVISTNTGSVHLLVTDSLAKKVAGASVVISHQQLGSVYLTGKNKWGFKFNRWIDVGYWQRLL